MRVPWRSAAPLALAALTIVLGAAVVAHGRDRAAAPAAGSWLGLVGETRAPTLAGQRTIVLLTTPSVAQRLAVVRFATESQERSWAAQALAAQQQVLTKLAALGVTVHPDFSYERVVDGFAAALDPRAISLLGRMKEVAGIFPVRALFPAAVSETVLAGKEFGPTSGHQAQADLPGFDGRGVTIALLDTGVDETHPYLRGKVLPGIDLVDHGIDAAARSNPQDPSQVERHGTELAGMLVGADGPGGVHGVAPGATVLPIRVAGWQPAADGHDLVYGRTDQLIAGLDRAVDPNGDGDTHDAVRVALVGLAAPYAAFTDGPEAQAVQGALDLNTVVVTPAGNDGAAGPAFGSIAGPAGAPGALAVGATDARSDQPGVRVVLRRGLDVIFAAQLPLAGAGAPSHSLTLQVAEPRATRGLAGSQSIDYFDAHGYSLVAGRAVVLPVGGDPQAEAIAASSAGAAAVVFYGAPLAPGALQVAEDETAPVVVVPAPAAIELLAAQRAGIDVGIALGPERHALNPSRGRVAGFSSQGLSFDGGIKPNVAAPGVALVTSEPGAAADGSPLYGTVNGTSGAAATVAGGAALLAQMRPALDGPSLQSLLVGYAQQGSEPAWASGAGTFSLGAAAVGEVAAQPTTLGFGIWQGPRWHATRTLVVRNVSTRRLQLSVSVVAGGESEALKFAVVPDRLVLRPGRAARVQVTLRVPTAPAARIVTGAVQIAPWGSETLHVPWAVEFVRTADRLLGPVRLDRTSFAPSDASPAILSVQAGSLVHDHGLQIEPVSRLDILLYSGGGRYLGVLVRLRDLLPGSYSFGITGRGPTSALLAPGPYELRVAAWPTLPSDAKPSRAQVSFRIE
ncbi:MAG TPA: S8 family serine peptidase [Gaiellaceae bacterium]|nr:S8 family serine peptidase [Gaiellaceae bacterium]